MSGTAGPVGSVSAAGVRVAIVASRFNEVIVDALVDGSLSFLREHGARDGDVVVIRVPGAWEIPLAVDAVLRANSADAVIALGCLLRGETAHFELLAEECTRGLGRAMERHRRPVAHGVLACENEAQARARAGGPEGNKGREAAAAAVEMAGLLARIPRVEEAVR